MVGSAFLHHGRSLPLLSGVLRKEGSALNESIVQAYETHREQEGWLDLMFFGGFTVVFLLVFGWGSYLMLRMIFDHRKVLDFKARQRMTFMAYLSYRFEYWFSDNDNSNEIILFFITLGTLMLGAVIYCLSTGAHVAESAFLSFVQLVAPDAGVDEETTAGRTCCAIMSVLGLVIFALLLTLLQDSFTSWLDSHKEGRTDVIESGHVVIIGLQEYAFPVLDELCACFEAEGGRTICILATELTKEVMEQSISDTLPDLDTRGSKIVVRAGSRNHEVSFKHVAADTARIVLIIPDQTVSKEFRDSSQLRTLVALRSSGWPLKGRILVPCSLGRNKHLFKVTGGAITDVIMTSTFIAQLMVKGSAQWGLGRVIHQMFGFDGVKFCIKPVPEHLEGKSMFEASLYYPKCVLAGIGKFPSGDVPHHEKDGQYDKCILCPLEKDGVLQKSDHLVLLATDMNEVEPQLSPYTTTATAAVVPKRKGMKGTDGLTKSTETIVFLGWNDLIGRMLYELDYLVAKGTKVVILSGVDVSQRKLHLEKEAKRFSKRLANIESIIHIQGPLGSQFILERLPVSLPHADRIFVLADESVALASPEYTDTCTIASVVHVRELIIRLRQKDPSSQGASMGMGHGTIVPEIRTPESKKHCKGIHASDFIDTAGLLSQIAGMTTWDSRVLTVLEDILGEQANVTLSIERLESYSQETLRSVDFCQVQGMVAASGGVLVGWSEPDVPVDDKKKKKSSDEFKDTMQEVFQKANPDAIDARWELNPMDKLAKRDWDPEKHRLVLFKPRGERRGQTIMFDDNKGITLGAEQIDGTDKVLGLASEQK